MTEPQSFDDDPAHAVSLSWYAQRRPVFTGGNDVTLLRGGRQLFPTLVHAIDQARDSVWLANYLTAPKGLAGHVLQALGRAAQRGVEVYVVMDGVGSRDVAEAQWQALRDEGVRLAIYRPVSGVWSALNSRNWRRMHLKVCVVDQTVAFVGGINLIDDHYDLVHGWSTHPRLDYAVQVRGPVMGPMLHTVRAMWTRATLGRDWRDDLIEWIKVPGRLRRARHLWTQARLRLPPGEQGQLVKNVGNPHAMQCAFVLRDNLRQRRTIELAAVQAIQRARERIDIVTPYFYPGRTLRRALREAAGRGVQVRLLLQGKVDYRIAGVAARVLYDELQLGGVRIFEYQPAWLHAKVLSVDEAWTSIGSSNLDPLSLLVNLEANLIVKDRGFAQRLSAELARDFADSTEVPRPLVLRRTRAGRLMRALVAWAAQVYLRLAGVSRRF